MIESRDKEECSLEKDFLTTDRELVRRAKSGELWATDELFRRHYQRAYSLAYALCSGDGEGAKDMIQEAFIKAFQGLGKFKEGSNFYTWLFRIIVNTSLDRRRRINRWKRVFSFWSSFRSEGDSSKEQIEIEDTNSESNPFETLENRERGVRIQDALMALPKNQRIAFHLKVVEGMKVKEIARIMGTAEGTVKSHLFRAIQTLRESLGDLVS
ncbi:MAG: sigma-70 family RNA polymerase sigma factor [Deltaproteobacteria bacterium]|nr:sigma-70 family RNA polymerase sigma factor [Deltaproteobacteria bacterium]